MPPTPVPLDAQALHGKILAKISRYESSLPVAALPLGALRAVVERHPPEPHYLVGMDNRRKLHGHRCKPCRSTYPCADIWAIAEALGIEVPS
jgi:hypothetical protein